jgi:signal transduction protein with GAF and PtsI domain
MSDPKITLESPAPATLSGLELQLDGTGSPGAFQSRASFAVHLFDALIKDTSFSDFITDSLLALLKVIPAEAASLLEADQRRGEFRFRGVIGQSSDRIREFTIPMNRGIVGEVGRTGRGRLATEANEDPLHLRSVSDAVSFETRNLVAVPVFIRGRLFGVIELLNRVSQPTFSQDDLDLLQDLCETMLAKAIEARLMIAWAAKTTGTSDSQAA